MKKNPKTYLSLVLVILMGFTVWPSFSAYHKAGNGQTFTNVECIESYLDNIAGDTYCAKFKNNCDDDYKVYYEVTDGDKTIQEATSITVKAHSSNVSGTFHCSANAKIKIIKKEVIK